MAGAVRTDVRGPVVEVVLDRPKANAIDAETSRELGRVFADFRDDSSLRVAILTGAGERFFSAGWDLVAAADGEEYEADYGPGGFGGFPELPDLTKPIIVAVNGMAVGGGFEMVMAADLVVAAEHATFMLPEVKAGIMPDAGAIRLPRILPKQLANEVLFAGRVLTAPEAMGFGLVNSIVETEDLMAEARTLAARVVEGAPLGVAAILETVRDTSGMDLASAFAHLRSGAVMRYAEMLDSEDAQEGPAAFAEKRDPVWKGR